MRYKLLAMLCGASLFTVGNAQATGQVSGQLGVQITIGAGCEVNGGTTTGSVNNFGTLNFGSYPLLNNTIVAQSTGASGALAVNCTTGTLYTVALNSGANAAGNQRRMAGGTAEFINYQLYQDASRSTIWGNGANGGTVYNGTGTGSDEPLVVYGQVLQQTTPSEGTYADTVIVTVAF